MFEEIQSFSDGNILVHCNEGYHRGPVVAGLIWCSSKNSQADSQAQEVTMAQFLADLKTKRKIDPDPELVQWADEQCRKVGWEASWVSVFWGQCFSVCGTFNLFL